MIKKIPFYRERLLVDPKTFHKKRLRGEDKRKESQLHR